MVLPWLQRHLDNHLHNRLHNTVPSRDRSYQSGTSPWVQFEDHALPGTPTRMNTTNRLRNKGQYWGGRAKETVGRITGNRRTQYEGKLDQVKANLKDTGGKIKGNFKR